MMLLEGGKEVDWLAEILLILGRNLATVSRVNPFKRNVSIDRIEWMIRLIVYIYVMLCM